jgi:hypothetical protein
VFSELFDRTFSALDTWKNQNIHLAMDVLQCNLIAQMIFIIEGCIPLPILPEPKPVLSSQASLEGKFVKIACKQGLKTRACKYPTKEKSFRSVKTRKWNLK